MRKSVKTFKSILVTVLMTTAIAAGVKLSSVQLAAQAAKPETGNESALLKGFSEIAPIDTHIHVYKDDPKLNALIERLNLRAVNICVIDDRDPDFKGLEPQRTEVLKVRQSTRGRVAFCHYIQPVWIRTTGVQRPRDSPAQRGLRPRRRGGEDL